MFNFKAIKNFNPLDSSLKVIRQGELVQISFNPAFQTWHILGTQSYGHLTGWGYQIPVELKNNYFIDITKAF